MNVKTQNDEKATETEGLRTTKMIFILNQKATPMERTVWAEGGLGSVTQVPGIEFVQVKGTA